MACLDLDQVQAEQRNGPMRHNIGNVENVPSGNWYLGGVIENKQRALRCDGCIITISDHLFSETKDYTNILADGKKGR
jgi:hypothetical protein